MGNFDLSRWLLVNWTKACDVNRFLWLLVQVYVLTCLMLWSQIAQSPSVPGGKWKGPHCTWTWRDNNSTEKTEAIYRPWCTRVAGVLNILLRTSHRGLKLDGAIGQGEICNSLKSKKIFGYHEALKINGALKLCTVM